MKTTISIELFDNGITICEVPDGDNETITKIVSLGHSKMSDLGKLIWEDIQAVMDNELKNKVRMEIKISTE